MRIGIAYAAVVLIWSTTPLGIKWSNSSLTFVTAFSSRVMLALFMCVSLLVLLRRPLIQNRNDWQAYFAGLIGLYPNMLIVYWSAQHIPSGLAAVIFGLYPFMVGVFSFFILKENIFNSRRLIALGVALIGLVVINLGQLNLGDKAIYGVLGMASSTVLFGLSSVWMKKAAVNIDPLRQSTGVLLLAAPLIAATWFVMDGNLPTDIDQRSITGVLYLAIAGSVLGGTLFFYILKHCRVSSVGLITFITPVVAMFVGVVVDGERFTYSTVVGCSLVILSLAIYQDVFRYVGNLSEQVAAKLS